MLIDGGIFHHESVKILPEAPEPPHELDVIQRLSDAYKEIE